MKPRILLVDDDALLRTALTRLYRRFYDIVCAESSTEALLRLEDSGPFDIVVSDHQMPEGTGTELLHKVREQYPHVGRLLLSGDLMLSEIISAQAAGDIDKALNKPCTREQLLEAIDTVLTARRSSDDAA